MSEPLKPCPFCGAHLRHVESVARSFDPPQVYHEFHHPAGTCLLSRTGRFFPGAEPLADFIAAWNRREEPQP